MILRHPDNVTCFTDDGLTNDYEIGFSTNGTSGTIQLSAPSVAVTELRLRWNHRQSGPAVILGDHWERGYGDLEWRGVVPERVLPWYALVHFPASGRTESLGVQTGAASFASWRVDQSGITLVLDVRCGGRGVNLGSRTLAVAQIEVAESNDGESAFRFAQRFCRQLCPNPRLPEMPVYGGNDWYYAYGKNSEASILRDAEIIRNCSPDPVNSPFMVIDAGWFPAEGCGGGPYDHGNSNFPDMDRVASQMRSIDVRPGIWIRPLLTQDAPTDWKLPAQHPIHSRERGAVLDPSVPEVLELVKNDIARLREWGYSLIKHDFTTFDLTGRWGFEMGDRPTVGDWTFADSSRTTAEITRDLYAAIRDAAGDAILIGCNTVGHLGAGLFELQRTGDDTSGREWERTRKMGVNTLAFRMPQHEAFFAVDADCVGLTNDVPWELNRQWLDILARSGTPLFVSADPNALGADQTAALKEAFAVAAKPQPVAEPLDWMETTCPERWEVDGETRTYEWTRVP